VLSRRIRSFYAEECRRKQRGPQNWGALRLHPLGIGGAADPTKYRTPLPYKSYLAERGRSAFKGVGINRGELQKAESAGTMGCGVVDPLEIRLPHMCCPANFGRSMSNDASLMQEITLKNLTPRVPPFKFNPCHWNWHGAIGCL